MADPAVPSLGLAVGREIDERVARNSLLAERARQALQLGGVVEVPGRLQETERPPRRQRRAPEELGHLAHEAAQVGADQEVPGQRGGLGRVVDAHAVVRATDRERRVTGIVEEQRVASVRDQQRDRDVRARPMAEMRVPELAALPEAIEPPAALAETVEVLLAGEREAGAHAPGAGGAALEYHPSVGGLAQEPGAGGVGERQAQRMGLDLEPQIARRQPDGLAVGDFERRRRPDSRTDERRCRATRVRRGRRARYARCRTSPDRSRRAREIQARVPTLEACRVLIGCRPLDRAEASRTERARAVGDRGAGVEASGACLSGPSRRRQACRELANPLVGLGTGPEDTTSAEQGRRPCALKHARFAGLVLVLDRRLDLRRHLQWGSTSSCAPSWRVPRPWPSPRPRPCPR